jgi:hypothetical protein
MSLHKHSSCRTARTVPRSEVLACDAHTLEKHDHDEVSTIDAYITSITTHEISQNGKQMFSSFRFPGILVHQRLAGDAKENNWKDSNLPITEREGLLGCLDEARHDGLRGEKHVTWKACGE